MAETLDKALPFNPRNIIGLDKRGYQVNIFLISPQKHMLWVLIRSGEVLLMSTHNIWFRGEIRKISILLD